MLYEVITQPEAFLHEDIHPVCPDVDYGQPRITSYNVCYTKLLRKAEEGSHDGLCKASNNTEFVCNTVLPFNGV